MARLAAAVAFCVALASCGGDGADTALASAVGLAGTVCRVPVRAGAVVIGDDLVLTAAHVVAGAAEGIDVVSTDGSTVAGVIVGFDPERDLALIATSGLEPEPAPQSSAEEGDAGFILAVDPAAQVTRYDYTVARRITATGDDIYGEGNVSRKALEVVVDISPGASGAATFDGEGRVVGIVFAESRSRGVAYAVDASEIEAFLAETDPTTVVEPGPCR
jgi:S1-C subfamily serine protease